MGSDPFPLRKSPEVMFWVKPVITSFFLCWFILERRLWPTEQYIFHLGPGLTQVYLKLKVQQNSLSVFHVMGSDSFSSVYLSYFI